MRSGRNRSRTRVLFVHEGFPGQYCHLAPALARLSDHQVVFVTRQRSGSLPGVKKLIYTPTRLPRSDTHPYLQAAEAAVLSGQAAYRACASIKRRGFVPDVVCAHAGFGPGLFIRDLFPHTRLLGLFEWYYRARGSDADYLDPDAIDANAATRIRMRNATLLLELEQCDVGICPTGFQRAQFPSLVQQRLVQLHDGIDTEFFAPGPGRVPAGLAIPDHAPVVTYATRGLEPYRGFGQFMRAAAMLLRQRPDLHVVVAGADAVFYSQRAATGSYKAEALAGIRQSDRARLHFTGTLPQDALRDLFRRSAVHVYLTVPYVLSWSILEAMATGCLLIASDTAPVREVAKNGVEAILVDFHSPEGLAGRILECLQWGDGGAALRQRARARIARDYSVRRLLPRHIDLIRGLDGAESRLPQSREQRAERGQEGPDHR
jgi:glycosyltransferase involved in cell wall biosynthesis